MKRFRILIVDDEARILNFLVSKLRASGYDVLTASNGTEGLDQVKAQEPDLIVLDVLMPKMDGLTMLKELRSFSSLPVIVLTAKGTDTDRIRGLQLGADDYLPKPFNPDELVARIEAIRRRVVSADKREVLQSYNFGDISVDFKNRNVTVAKEPKYLTRIEWLLLSQLISNAGRLMLYEELLTSVWGPEYRDDVQILRTWISRLRNKLGGENADEGIIRTIPKTGYIIDRPDAE
ncbi:MAG TPA: response regulator transcription factor [Dehalococcoidales bacterium]|nr:response regulator transcription factor [Dehalococcoidales bacterium]